MYTVGGEVVHPLHGAGVIREIVTRRVDGVDRDYYVLQIPVGEIVVMTPVDAADTVGMRPVSSREDAQRVMDALPDLEAESSLNWNQRYRENMEKLRSGQLLEVARVIKCLMLRGRSRALSTGERRMLMTARQIFLSEMVLALGESETALEGKLDRAILGGPYGG